MPRQAQAQNSKDDQLQCVLVLLQKTSQQQADFIGKLAAQDQRSQTLEEHFKKIEARMNSWKNTNKMHQNEAHLERGEAELRHIPIHLSQEPMDHRFLDDPYANSAPHHGRAYIPSTPEDPIRQMQPRQQTVCDPLNFDKRCLRFD